MKPECRAFRSELRAALERPGTAGEWRDLAWHRHMHDCAACRDLLAAEEALDALLESLPRPQLPPRLAKRVLARLAAGAAPQANLDALLDLDRAPAARAGLAERVLAHLAEDRALAHRRAPDLDELLERARAVEIPVGLAQRTCRALESHRTAQPVGTAQPTGTAQPIGTAQPTGTAQPARTVPRFALRWRWTAAAAVFVALLGLYALAPRTPKPEPLVTLNDQPDPRMLENLMLLEEWDLLRGSDLELLLSTLPDGDEYLLELEADNSVSNEQGGEPKKG